MIVFIVEIHMRLHTEEEPYRCKVKGVVACWSDSQQRVGKLELKLKQAVAINRSLKKQRSEMRKYVKMTKKEM